MSVPFGAVPRSLYDDPRFRRLSFAARACLLWLWTRPGAVNYAVGLQRVLPANAVDEMAISLRVYRKAMEELDEAGFVLLAGAWCWLPDVLDGQPNFPPDHRRYAAAVEGAASAAPEPIATAIRERYGVRHA